MLLHRAEGTGYLFLIVPDMFMPDNFSTFPSNGIEAIAYLYVQKKVYDNPTPELLAEDYMKAYKEVHKFFLEHKGAKNWRY